MKNTHILLAFCLCVSACISTASSFKENVQKFFAPSLERQVEAVKWAEIDLSSAKTRLNVARWSSDREIVRAQVCIKNSESVVEKKRCEILVPATLAKIISCQAEVNKRLDLYTAALNKLEELNELYSKK